MSGECFGGCGGQGGKCFCRRPGVNAPHFLTGLTVHQPRERVDVAVEDLGWQRLGDVVLSEVEIASGQRDPRSGELRLAVSARVRRLIEAKRDEYQLPGAMAFRRALQGCE